MEKLPLLNFPQFNFKLKETALGVQVFDPCRKRWVKLTPEEWVRQHCLAFLMQYKNYPQEILQVECNFKLNGLSKRVDVLAGYPPNLLVECKAPEVNLSQAVLHQALRYNLSWQVEWLMLSNGMQHLLFRVDAEGNIEQANELPNWK